MEVINVYNIKAEKANAIRKYRQRRRIANFLRFLEICLVLALISRFSTQLPSAVKNSGNYFRLLSVTLISPRFVFVLGNAIVVTLFAKSGQFSGERNSNSSADPCEEFMKNKEKEEKTLSIETDNRSSNLGADYDAHSFKERKNDQKRQWEDSDGARIQHEKLRREVRRSETVRGPRERIGCGERGGESSLYAEDKMSEEEFRRTVEAFIARQQRFRMEEE